MTSSQGMTTVSMTVGMPRLLVPFEALELHAGELPVLDDEARRRVVDEDLDTFLLGVLELPGGRLEERARPPRHHLDVLAAEAERRAAAVHRGVADADDQHTLADRVGVAEGDRLEPVDADVDPIAIVPPRDVEVLATRRPGADENRVEVLLEELAEAGHRGVQAEVDAHVDDGRDLLVEDLRGQPEGRDVRAHQPTRHDRAARGSSRS